MLAGIESIGRIIYLMDGLASLLLPPSDKNWERGQPLTWDIFLNMSSTLLLNFLSFLARYHELLYGKKLPDILSSVIWP